MHPTSILFHFVLKRIKRFLSHCTHCFVFTVENVKEVLKLSVEQKGAVVQAGELTVFLDGLTVTDQEELAQLTNGNGTSEHSVVYYYYFYYCHYCYCQGCCERLGWWIRRGKCHNIISLNMQTRVISVN